MTEEKLKTGQWVTCSATGERLLVLEDQTASSILLTWDAEGKSLRAVNPKDMQPEGMYQYALQSRPQGSDDAWDTFDAYWQVAEDPADLVDWSDGMWLAYAPAGVEKRVVRRLSNWQPTELEPPK
jgi:hypothetical protein